MVRMTEIFVQKYLFSASSRALSSEKTKKVIILLEPFLFVMMATVLCSTMLILCNAEKLKLH